MSLTKFQREICTKILDTLMSWPICAPFMVRLDPNEVRNREYFDIIKEPMALEDIKYKLDNNSYRSVESYAKDVNLIWENARKFNGEGDFYTIAAMEASEWFNAKMKKFPNTQEEKWMMRAQKIANELRDAFANPPSEIAQNKEKLQEKDN